MPQVSVRGLYMNKNLFCKGYTWGFFSPSGMMQTEAAERSMERLASNGLDWICIPVNAWQESFADTRIFSDYERTQTDSDLLFAVNKARTLGLKICLKPMVNCFDRAWRARIDFPPENPEYWDKWFKSYTAFMLHYAELAQKTGCEMLCTGCEMAGMDKQSERCRKMIAEVRKVYGGIIMHNINHGDELRFDWLYDVDVIGISGYYPVTDGTDRSLEHMIEEFERRTKLLEKAHKHYGKPIMFAEIGVRNEQGCSQYPWDFHNRPEMPSDEQEQADFYEAAMTATWDKEWFCGYFWWDWKAKLPPIEKAKENRDFTIYGKKAEQVLKSWYSKAR